MNKKKIMCIISILCLICIYLWTPKRNVLHIGIFSGSNWDVPSSNSYKVIDDVIARFEEKYPNIEVEYESGILKEDYSLWLSNKILKGEEPDVFMVLGEDFNTLSELGILKNLDTQIQMDTTFDKNAYFESLLEAGEYNKHQYALPYECNPQLMFVNQTLLEKEGLQVPNGDWTLDDLYKICQKVTKDSDGDGMIDQWGCYNFDWLNSIYCHGETLFNESGTSGYFTQNRIKEAILYIQKLDALNQGHMISSQEFDEGNVAFSPLTFAQYRTYKPYPWRIKKYSAFKWDCVKLPTFNQNIGNSEVSTLLMGISARSHHPLESWEFLKMLTYDEDTQASLFQYSQGVPAIKNVLKRVDLQNDEIDLKLLDGVMENAIHHDRFKKYESALMIADNRIKEILKNEEDLDISLMNLQKEINQYLNDGNPR